MAQLENREPIEKTTYSMHYVEKDLFCLDVEAAGLFMSLELTFDSIEKMHASASTQMEKVRKMELEVENENQLDLFEDQTVEAPK